MKIALLTDGLYPEYVGGMQKHSTFLARYLAGKGVDVDVYLRAPESGVKAAERQFNDAGRGRIELKYVPFPVAGRLPGHYIRESYVYSSRIFEAIKDCLEVDFIYTQGFAGWRLLQEKSRGLRCAPVGVNFHGLEMYQLSATMKERLQHGLFRPFVSRVLRSADASFSLGGRLGDIIASIGVPQERIYLSPNGVDASWLVTTPAVSPGLRRFLFVGRYERRKGIEELARVIERLAAAGVPFAFDFVGPIPDQLRLKQSRVRYHGTVTDSAQMQAIMQGCDCLVCPSYAEGMPTVIMEAMASGLAVVATDVGAVPAMLDAGSGWLIPPGDEGALELALRRAIDLPDGQLLAMKRAGLERARKDFLWDAVATTTLKQMQRIIQRHAH